MRSVSDAFKSLAASGDCTASVRVLMYPKDSETATEIGPSSVASVEVSRSIGDNCSYAIGSVDAATMTMSVLTSALPDSDQLDGCSIYVTFILMDRQGINYACPMGVFVTTRGLVEDNGMFSTVTAYEPLYWLTGDYATALTRYTRSSTGTYTYNSHTAAEIVAEICEAGGVEYDEDSVPDMTFQTLLPNGDTVRDALSSIASAMFCNVSMEDGVVKFYRYGEDSVSFDAGDYMPGGYTFKKGESVSYDSVGLDYNVTAAKQLANLGEKSIRLPSGATGSAVLIDSGCFSSTLEDDDDGSGKEKTNRHPSAVALDRLKVDMDTIYANAGDSVDFSYGSFDLSVWNNCHVQCGDKVTVADRDGVQRDYVVFSETHVYDGTIKSTFSYDQGVSEDVSLAVVSPYATAIAAAQMANATADSKRRVFYGTPYPPYDVGDLWIDYEDGVSKIYVCTTAKEE